MNGSPSSSAAMAARWVKTGTPEVVNCTRFSIVAPSAGGASSQPMRQPVIAQFFDNVCTKRILSLVAMMS